jgi:hypothetical protein
MFPSVKTFLLIKIYRKCAAINLDTYAPPCPSNTPKRDKSSKPGTSL